MPLHLFYHTKQESRHTSNAKLGPGTTVPVVHQNSRYVQLYTGHPGIRSDASDGFAFGLCKALLLEPRPKGRLCCIRWNPDLHTRAAWCVGRHNHAQRRDAIGGAILEGALWKGTQALRARAHMKGLAFEEQARGFTAWPV